MTDMDSDQIDIYSFLVVGTLVLLTLFCFIVVFLFLYKNRQSKHRYEIRAMEDRYGREILVAQLEIREQTLKYISQELHDNLGQVLSLAILHLSALELNDTRASMERIDLISDLVRKAISDLRNLSRSLDADKIEQGGLIEVLRFEMDILRKAGLYEVSFDLIGEEKRIVSSREIVLFRIVQEVLNNFIRHAQATRVGMTVIYGEASITVTVSDNGIGFDTTQVRDRSAPGGAGLPSMQKRTALIKGRLSIESHPGQGTRTEIIIPYEVS